MADKKQEETLFESFSPISSEEWKEKIIADLKGADFERKLVWRTKEGINAQPYYRTEDLENLEHLNVLPGEFPYVRSTKVDNDWYVRQDIDASKSLTEANKKALDVLNKGANSIGFVLDCEKEYTADDIKTLLKDICVEAIELNIDAGMATSKVLEILKENYAGVIGSFEFDPIGRLTTKGNFCKEDSEVLEICKGLVEDAQGLKNFRTLTVNGRFFNNAGSSLVEELAFSLASANEYLAKLTDLGLTVDQVAQKIKFNFAVGGNYFMEIAKFRAARMLWATIVKQYEAKEEASLKINIHAETSLWNKTVYDPYVNMLRTTTEGMSAVIAGVDSLTINPFDKIYQTPNEFSERIARNQQLLLKEESYFDKIVDPSSGSYYIENLTDSLAEQAWALFQEVEDKGGYVEAFKAGFIQAKLAETAQKRDMAIATRKENLLGTNQFPNFGELAEEKIDFDTIKAQDNRDETIIGEPIKIYRGAEAFEELRLRTDKSGKRPVAFMLTIGHLAMRKARSQFSCNFFACAGFEVIDNNGFATVEEGVKAAQEANADIVVVCSSDDEYTEVAPAAFEQLKGKATVVVAGAPANMEELKAKGLEHFVHVKTNVLESLKGFQQIVGIK